MTEAIEIVSKEEQAAIAELGSTGESHLAVAEAMAITVELNKIARANQDSLDWPGVRFFAVTGIRSRG